MLARFHVAFWVDVLLALDRNFRNLLLTTIENCTRIWAGLCSLSRAAIAVRVGKCYLISLCRVSNNVLG